ncbi:polyamine-modulated factor 1-binding protein 1-like isoform X2 [Frankliniella occidentalis]|uniref:Polyamine-modulated factor 1-binding protein 1-like isoform X2 n=1 Tax=Frankliniella occidentalis TaxID=133901 RepID=A0A6J1T398_FRAOC|nr:polyamine-modulated factor 1-binding protein 1-like isoform X2 [Frankliniella occidentalis]
MSVDTITTCTTIQRNCRLKGRSKRSSMKKDPTSKTELTDLKTLQINVEDNLGLDQLEVCDIPQDMLFPGEYNVYLQDRLKSVIEENKQLASLLKEKDDEVISMREKLQNLELSENGLPLHHPSPLLGLSSIRHADMAACRVMELSKQVCELTAQLEEQKCRCSLAENKLVSFIESQEEIEPVSPEILTRKEAEIKSLSEKLSATNGKLFECRNKVQHLQQELKNAHKVLLCEVGEGISISDLISGGGSTSGWRGRAQQIHVLQLRVAELTDRIKKSSDFRIYDSLSHSCDGPKCSAKERKASLESAQQEARAVQQQLNEHIRKLDAAKARIKVLETEISSCKSRIQLLTDKGVRDEDFIHILQGQINQLEGRLHLCKDETRMEIKKSEKHYQQLLDDHRLEKQRSMQLLSSLEDKEKQIKRLEDILFDLKDKEINTSKGESKCCGEVAESLVMPATVACPTEITIKENPKMSLSEIETKKLLELVGTVNRRLNDTRHECDKHKSALRHERQRLARLEAKLARLEMDKMGPFSTMKRQFGNGAKKSAALISLESSTLSKEELEDKLELLQEEVLTLKTRLSCLEQEKEDDLRAFSSLLYGSSQQRTSLVMNPGAPCLPPIEPGRSSH